MASYTVTTANWNDPLFWSSIVETTSGHTLDFSALDTSFGVTISQSTGIITIGSGATTFTIGESGVTGTDANFGAGTLLDFFTSFSGAQGQDIVTGTSSADVLDGNSGADLLFGENGDDTLYGNGGSDLLEGGAGADLIYGGADLDDISGGDGADELFGETGNDTIDGGAGEDFINGGRGADLIYGGADADHLEGGWEDDASDTIWAGSGNDLVFGYGGDDSIYGETGNDWIDGGAGNDFMDGAADDDRIVGDLGSDTILGGAGYDVLTGGEGADSIDGGDDADQIWGNAGDTIFGGEGGDDSDTLFVSHVDFITFATAESGTITFNSGDTLQFSGIEVVTELTPDGVVDGTAGADQMGQFYFDADGEWIDNGDAIGEGDGDSVRAGDGNDTIWSNDGNDTVHGEAGDDQIYLGGGDNLAFGGAGADTIGGEWQNDTISGDDFVATGPNLIVNGSFEDTTGMSPVGYGFTESTGNVAGWTDANGNPIDFHNDGRGGLIATDGANWMDMEAGAGQQNVISQTVAGVQDGQVYVLSFDMADQSNINDGTTLDNQLQVIWNGEVVGTIDASDGSWTSYEFHLIGGSGDGSNTLTFAGLGGADANGASLDNVQMYAAAEAVGGADSIDAWDGNDDIMAGGGDDTVLAGTGEDLVVAGSGNDSVVGDAGNDTVYGGDGNLLNADDPGGNDSMWLGTGDDLAYGEGGNDVIYGDDGFDTISGNEGADELYGGDGSDQLQGGQGSDTVSGGNDADTIVGDGQWYQLTNFASGAGTIATNLTVTNSADGPIELWWIDETGTAIFYQTIEAGDTFVQGTFEGHNWLLRDEDGFYLDLIAAGTNTTVDYGAEGLNDSLSGDAGDDDIRGQFGNDTLFGGSGSDTLLGGDGMDVHLVSDDSDFDSIDGGEGAADWDNITFSNVTSFGGVALTLTANEAGDYTFTDGGATAFGSFVNIEQFVFNTANDTVDGTASSATQQYFMGGGDDLVAAGGGDDTLAGDAGADTLSGGGGNDSLSGGADADTFVIEDGFGNDTIVGGDTFTTGLNVDTIDLSAVTNPVNVLFDGTGSGTITDTVTGDVITFSGIERLILSDAADVVDASADGAGVEIIAGGGDDTLLGGTGNDTLLGGDGNDSIDDWANDSRDYIEGGAGNDTILTGIGADTVFGGDGDDSIVDRNGFDQFWGGAGNDTLDGGASSDTLHGGTGDDLLIGGGGSGSQDRLFGEDGNDTLLGGQAADVMDGGADADTFIIEDGFGNDTILGGDTFTTGANYDTIDLSALSNPVIVTFDGPGSGTITDFVTGEVITFSGIEQLILTNNDDLVDATLDDGHTYIQTLAGNDSVQGSPGDDLYDDEIFGPNGQGNDTFIGGDGADEIWAGTDDDSISGGAGSDTLSGQSGNDTIDGGGDADSLYGGLGDDSVTGGAGNDLIEELGPGGTAVNNGGTITGTTSADGFVFAGAAGTSATIILDDGAGTAADGDGEADWVYVTSTGDGASLTLEGFDYGTDRIVVSEQWAGISTTQTGADSHQVTLTYAGGTTQTFDIIHDGGASFDAAQVFFTYAGNDTLEGGDGNDTIIGAFGDDLIDGGAGDDSLVGGDGDDTLIAGNNTGAGDTLEGGAGNDVLTDSFWNATLDGGDDADLINAGFGAATISGGEGGNDDDTLSFAVADDAVSVTLSANEAGDYLDADGDSGTFTGIENFELTSGDDTLDASATTLGTTVASGAGADILTGGSGDDSLDGGADADTFIVLNGFANDTIVGGDTFTTGADIDTIDLSALTNPVNVLFDGTGSGTITDTVTGDVITFSGIERLILTEGADVVDASADGAGVDIIAAGGNDTITGGTGNDTIDAGLGDDSLVAGDGADTLAGGGGADWIDAGTGDDTVDGGTENDTVFAWTGDDSVTGGDGDDQIFGQDGNDTIIGGAGADYLDGDDSDFLVLSIGGTDRNGIPPDFEVRIDGVLVFTGTVTWAQDGAAPFDPSQPGAFQDVFIVLPGGTPGTVSVTFINDFIPGDETAPGEDRNIFVDGIQVGETPFEAETDATITNGGAVTGDSVMLWGTGSTATFDTSTAVVGGADSILGDAGNDTLVGDAGNDTLFGGADDDSIFGGADDDQIEGGTGNDQLFGEDGNDNLNGQEGDDTILGGDGNDTIIGFEGSDSVLGGAGDDVINTRTSPGTGVPDEGFPGFYAADTDTANDTDFVDGGTGNDSILTGDDNDTVLGGDGADTIDAGFDDDLVSGGAGIDSIEGNEGNDTIDGGAGGDVIYGDVSPDNPDFALYAPFELPNDGTDLAPGNNADSLSGGDGNDSIYGQDDNDTLEGGLGDDLLDGGIDNDLLDGGDGADTLIGGSGNDTLLGGNDASADSLDGGAGDDQLSAGGGDDTLSGGLGADSMFAGDGADSLDGGAGDDTLDGWAGNDIIDGGAGNDLLTGGDGNDTFVYQVGDGLDTITDFNFGNTGTLNDSIATNNDFIDLSAFYDNIAELQDDYADDGVLNQSNAGNTVWGAVVDYGNNTSFDTDGIADNEGLAFAGQTPDGNSFTQENTGVVCFTPGTLILTETGEREIESLKPGDRIVTRDNGVQPLQWLARRRIGHAQLEANPKLRPVLIQPEVIGSSAPLLVSPQHGVLLRPDGHDETLVRATHLARLDGGKARVAHGIRQVTYIHLMFDAHQIVFANGAPSESFYPGPQAIGALAEPARDELRALFPAIFSNPADEVYGAKARIFARYKDLPRNVRDIRAA